MDLRQILITPPIKKAILEINSEIDLSKYKIKKSMAGFRLSRMPLMMAADFQKLLLLYPVEIRAATIRGRKMGYLIDGKIKPLYEIINGRHRVARAIIDGQTQINVKII